MKNIKKPKFREDGLMITDYLQKDGDVTVLDVPIDPAADKEDIKLLVEKYHEKADDKVGKLHLLKEQTIKMGDRRVLRHFYVPKSKAKTIKLEDLDSNESDE